MVRNRAFFSVHSAGLNHWIGLFRKQGIVIRENYLITEAVRSKAYRPAVFDYINTGIVSSNSTEAMNVCPPFSMSVLFCVGRGLEEGQRTLKFIRYD
jgi:hypothetical protein